MDEIVIIVDKKDKIVQNIELERERAEIEDIAMSVENKIHIKGNKIYCLYQISKKNNIFFLPKSIFSIFWENFF